MTNEKLNRTALKILDVLKPCLKKTRGETGFSLYPTGWGRKTEVGLVETVRTIIKNGGVE